MKLVMNQPGISDGLFDCCCVLSVSERRFSSRARQKQDHTHRSRFGVALVSGWPQYLRLRLQPMRGDSQSLGNKRRTTERHVMGYRRSDKKSCVGSLLCRRWRNNSAVCCGAGRLALSGFSKTNKNCIAQNARNEKIYEFERSTIGKNGRKRGGGVNEVQVPV